MSICHPWSSAGLESSQVMLRDLFSTHCMWQGKSLIHFLFQGQFRTEVAVPALGTLTNWTVILTMPMFLWEPSNPPDDGFLERTEFLMNAGKSPLRASSSRSSALFCPTKQQEKPFNQHSLLNGIHIWAALITQTAI